MKEQILRLVREKRNVSFVEISEIAGASPGPYSIDARPGSNVILWSGLSEEAATALDDLEREGLIQYDPTSVIVYLVDGAVQDIPLVKSPAAMKRGYKKTRWLPVVINPTETIAA